MAKTVREYSFWDGFPLKGMDSFTKLMYAAALILWTFTAHDILNYFGI